MEFANDKHRAAYERVLAITSPYGDIGTMTDNTGFVLRAGMNRVFILVLPWTPDSNVLQVRAYPEIDLTLAPELADHLLTTNSRVVLGAWGWETGRVFYQYTVLADDIDEAMFNATLGSVVAAVESQAPELAEKWGIAGTSESPNA